MRHGRACVRSVATWVGERVTCTYYTVLLYYCTAVLLHGGFQVPQNRTKPPAFSRSRPVQTPKNIDVPNTVQHIYTLFNEDGSHLCDKSPAG